MLDKFVDSCEFSWKRTCDAYALLSSACHCEAQSDGAIRSPCVCHCEERSDVAIRIPCGSAKRTAVLWANAGKCNEFALSTTDLPGISAGRRIATPVFALVRNDMQKEGRVRGFKDVARTVRGNMPGVSGCKDAGRDDTFPLCHCEERSDVAIRVPAEMPGK